MKMLYGDLTSKVLEACFEVSNELGAGFLESVYQKALLVALRERGIEAQERVPLSVTFRGDNGDGVRRDGRGVEWVWGGEAGAVGAGGDGGGGRAGAGAQRAGVYDVAGDPFQFRGAADPRVVYAAEGPAARAVRGDDDDAGL